MDLGDFSHLHKFHEQFHCPALLFCFQWHPSNTSLVPGAPHQRQRGVLLPEHAWLILVTQAIIHSAVSDSSESPALVGAQICIVKCQKLTLYPLIKNWNELLKALLELALPLGAGAGFVSAAPGSSASASEQELQKLFISSTLRFSSDSPLQSPNNHHKIQKSWLPPTHTDPTLNLRDCSALPVLFCQLEFLTENRIWEDVQIF